MAIDLPRVRAVLFDFDGTLSDTDDAYVARMARLLRFLKEPQRGRAARRLVMEMEAPGNLAVLRTLSKAYGLAGARIGCLIGSAELVELVARVSPPYPLPGPSIAAALDALGPERMPIHRQRIADLLADRRRLAEALSGVEEIRSVREGGNFLFLEVDEPATLALRLAAAAVRVRFRPNAAPGGVRVTVGTAEENAALLAVFGLSASKPTRQAAVVRAPKETRIPPAIDPDRSAIPGGPYGG